MIFLSMWAYLSWFGRNIALYMQDGVRTLILYLFTLKGLNLTTKLLDPKTIIKEWYFFEVQHIKNK